MAVTDGGCGPHIRRYGLTIRDRSGFVLPTSGEKARGDAAPSRADPLDPQILGQHPLVLPNLAGHPLSGLALEEELDDLLGLGADDAVEEHVAIVCGRSEGAGSTAPNSAVFRGRPELALGFCRCLVQKLTVC